MTLSNVFFNTKLTTKLYGFLFPFFAIFIFIGFYILPTICYKYHFYLEIKNTYSKIYQQIHRQSKLLKIKICLSTAKFVLPTFKKNVYLLKQLLKYPQGKTLPPNLIPLKFLLNFRQQKIYRQELEKPGKKTLHVLTVPFKKIDRPSNYLV